MAVLEQPPADAAGEERAGRRALVLGALLGLAAVVVVALLRGRSVWNYSEGVYALTARMWLDGTALYDGVVLAQPPPVVAVGAAVLAVQDDLDWLRGVLAASQLLTGVLAAALVWRLTANRWATAVTPAIAVLTPWAVHEHATLLPELLLAPPLLGALLLAHRPRAAPVVGVLAGLAAFVKLPFVLPAAAVVLFAADRRRAALFAVGALALQWALALVVFGPELWRDIVTAQLQTGRRPLGDVPGVVVQGGWNLLPLVALAAVAVLGRARTRDPRLVLALAAVALATLATLTSILKLGTVLTVLVPIEAVLVPLAVVGVAVAARRVVAGAGLVLAVAMGVSLLLAPGSAFPFLRPGSPPAWARDLSPDAFRAQVATIRACPPGARTSATPLAAFEAGRLTRGAQPDGFITLHAETFAALHRAMDADPACP